MKCCIVKRDIKFSSILKLLLILLATVIISLFVPNSFAFALILIGIVITICLAPGVLMTEYEYNIEGDMFSVSVIKTKSSRKELFSCDIEYLISCVPYNNQNVSGIKIDATVKENSPYVIHFSEEGRNAYVIFSPSDDFVRELYHLAPSKVKLNIL